jgi:hypothetical protein
MNMLQHEKAALFTLLLPLLMLLTSGVLLMLL